MRARGWGAGGVFGLFVATVCGAVDTPFADAKTEASHAIVLPGASPRFAKLPVRFEANAGQWDERVRFVARQGGATLFITDEGMTFGLRDERRGSPRQEGRRSALSRAPLPALEAKTAAVTMKLVGAHPRDSAARGEEELVTKSNFILGNDRMKWRTHVPNYARVRASGWLPGVDVVWHAGGGSLEYDLDIAAGVDARALQLEVAGATRLGIAKDGTLEAMTPAGTLLQKPPRVLQAGRELPARYALSESNRVRFVIDGYDPGLAVLIDPAFAYSTFFGDFFQDWVASVAVDSGGDVYVTGLTYSDLYSAFPTDDPFQSVNAGPDDAFVAKLNAAGSALIYATYLGGSGGDSAQAIALDGSGNAYIAGATTSMDFPTQGPVQAVHGPVWEDAFVAALNADGSALLYSTYLGGSDQDSADGIAVDGAGNAYVTGYTESADFPTQNPLQANRGNPTSTYGDAFIAKLNATGSALVYSTYLGGSSQDDGRGIAVDGSGNAYVAGYTASPNFPTRNAVQPALSSIGAAFVAKLNAAGSSLVYSTFLGGSAGTTADAEAIAVDGSGSAYVVGSASSSFPTQNPLQAASGGDWDGFVAKLSPAGSALIYSTYLGGSQIDDVTAVAVDAHGNAYVAGSTASSDFPTHNPLQATNAGGNHDAFVARLNAAGSALLYSTYVGGSQDDEAMGIAVDAIGNAYLVGVTSSANFPTEKPLQAAYGGSEDGFVAKIGLEPGAACSIAAPCASGLCVDGVCCDTACAGGCDRCDLPGKVGTCTVVAEGDPGENPSCASPLACDGVSGACPTSCSGDMQCATGHYCAPDGTCKPGRGQGAACDAHADCRQPGCRECASGFCVDGFCCDKACSGQCEACDSLAGSCSPIVGAPHGSRPACADDFACDGAETATCEQAGGDAGAATGDGGPPTCADDHTKLGVDGSKEDCAPYKCNPSGCRTACASTDDCVARTICDLGTCVPPPDDGGGHEPSCSVWPAKSGEEAAYQAAWLTAALGLAWRVRRRRRSA